jgi:UDP-3-O-[3-hydroxymyristoyl] glucosamine N-acyltransferase
MGRELKGGVTAGDIAREIGLELYASDAKILSVARLEESCEGSLCFAKTQVFAELADDDCVLIASREVAKSRQGSTLISDNPRLDFARTLSYLNNAIGFEWNSTPPEIHSSARIGSNVVIGRGVRIGAGTVIHHNVVIGDEVVIGKNCVIKSGAVIGEEGFGFERMASGEALRLPHLGTVVIEDDVEVGSLTTVCRGTLANTFLGKGVKIDDHVHIAHNVHVEPHAFVIACAEISGGVRIGERAWIAPNASILNQLTIGPDSVVGLGAVVIRPVGAGETVAGNPARSFPKK